MPAKYMFVRSPVPSSLGSMECCPKIESTASSQSMLFHLHQRNTLDVQKTTQDWPLPLGVSEQFGEMTHHSFPCFVDHLIRTSRS